MNDFDWKLLKTLSSVESISQASEQLYLTQSALSKRIKQLENDLGVEIIKRNARGISMTPQGEYLALEAEKMLSSIEEIKKNVRSIGAKDSGIIKLGTTLSMERFVLPSLFQEYLKIHGDIDFRTQSGVADDVVHMVENGTINIGFIRGESKNKLCRQLINEDTVYVLYHKPITIEDLLDIPMIRYNRDMNTIKPLSAWWYDRFNVKPKFGLKVKQGDTCLEMIKKGHGYSIFLSPEYAEIEKDLFVLPLQYKDGTPLLRKTWMIWREESYRVGMLKNFIDFCIEYFHIKKD